MHCGLAVLQSSKSCALQGLQNFIHVVIVNMTCNMESCSEYLHPCFMHFACDRRVGTVDGHLYNHVLLLLSIFAVEFSAAKVNNRRLLEIHWVLKFNNSVLACAEFIHSI